jgi:hypothetical protein
MDTMYPRPPFITPILGNLPLLGPMFRFERGANRTFHQSVIMVNAVLLPRSLALAGYYGVLGGRKALAKGGRGADGAGYEDFISGKSTQGPATP